MDLDKVRLWVIGALLVGLALGVASAYDPVVVMVQRWFVFDEAYSHGWLVFGGALFLVCRQINAEYLSVKPSMTGVLLAGLTACGIALAEVINIRVLQQMGAVFLCWAVLVALAGWRTGWRFAVPLGFMIYAVPIWDQLTSVLVNLAVAVNHLLLEVRGIHFRVDGAFIHLLDVGTFEVAGGCSGLRYVVVSLTLATLFGALNLTRLRSWLTLHVSALALALIVNWLRIFVIVLVGYETEMESGLIKNHEFFGWLLFAAALVPFFILANRLARADGADGSERVTEARALYNTESARMPIARGMLALLATVGLVALPSTYGAATSATFQPPRLDAPAELGEWERVEALSDWQPYLSEPDQVVHAGYAESEGASDPVHLGVGYYAVQEQGKELVHYGTRLAGPEPWQRVRTRASPLRDWQTMIIEHRLRDSRRAVAFSYYVAGHWTKDQLMVKALMVPSALRGRRDGALVTLDTVCGTRSCEAALKRLDAVVTDDTQGILSQWLAPR